MENLVMDKMYVISRAQLDPIYQCVQGGHALVAFTQKYPEITKEWDNQYLIYLNSYTLDNVMKDLDLYNIPYAKFVEPDMGDCVTAIACYGDGRYFKDLKLVRA